MPSAELIGSVFSGLVLLIGAMATYTATRSRRVGEDARVMRKAYRTLETKYLAALAHIVRLEERLINRKLAVPKRPAELEADDDDDDQPPAQPPVLPPTRRRPADRE